MRKTKIYDLCVHKNPTFKNELWLILGFPMVNDTPCVSGILFDKTTLEMECTFTIQDGDYLTPVDYIYHSNKKPKYLLCLKENK